MAKRKIECSLDDIVSEYLKKVKCEKSSKMFEMERSGENDHSKSLKIFVEFLEKSEREKENRVEDDLGFEINFEAFQPEPKMPLTKPLTEKRYHGPKYDTERQKKTEVPKEFVEKIKNLGMKVEDAELLFKSKIDWCAVYSDNKIYCVEPGCDYSTTIDNEELTNHMIDVHKYGDYPCSHDHCNYVATSKKALNYHGQMHLMRSENNFWFKCLKPSCRSTFPRSHLLEHHMRLHNNELDNCQYCPYRYVYEHHYKDHLKKHFRIKDNKCDDCGLLFTTRHGLIEHATMHEGIIYNCLICKIYKSTTKNAMRMHLRREHSDLLGKNINWDSVKKYVELK